MYNYNEYFSQNDFNMFGYGMKYSPMYRHSNDLDYEYELNRKTLGAAMKTVVELIKKSVEGEKEDEMFYDFLISEAPMQEQKDIISDIRDDERKHNKMFRNLYTSITGKKLLTTNEVVNFVKPESYKEGLKKSLFGELKAVEKYRKILFELTDRKKINVLTEIITDELKHASKYNYLIAINQ